MTPEPSKSDNTFRISDDHLDIALAQVCLGFWEVNLSEGNAMTCTEQCKKNFGWDSNATFSYKDMLGCILPEDLLQMQAKVMYAIEHQELYAAQYRVKHKDGSVHWIEANGRVLYEAGQPQKILGTTIDITKKKDLEILRDELLSVAMHELKTPFSAVKVSLQLIERHLQVQNESKILNIATRALASTERITRLLGDISSPILAQSQGINLAKTDFDIRRLADEVADNARLIHPNFEILISAEDTELTVYADRYRIAQVITNLVNNGIKYSEEKTKLEIGISSLEGQVCFRVRDYGIGIDAADHQKIFQKFYRASASQSVDGLGIGLYVCAEIILRHAGSIYVENTIGPGTTVVFTIPGKPIENTSDSK